MKNGGKLPPNVRVLKGPPHSFGWLRRPELDRQYPKHDVWEMPDGALYLHPTGGNPLVLERVIEKD